MNQPSSSQNVPGEPTGDNGIPMGDLFPRRYLNPVYDDSAPDPFVLKHLGEYWAYITGFHPDGRAFGILRSPDLVEWEPVGGAMEPLPGGFGCYWAPEVVYLNGRFLMYYSVGNEELMEIRVAVANSPAGPFIDSGRKLTSEPFAIDAHVFEDEDGARYLFYATDFLEHTHVGTGTVVDRMLDPFTLAGHPRPVTRAHYDWQVYDPQRASKGGVRWHTVEGPTVLKRKGRYFEMFSGGNWQNITYGVSYAVTDSITREGEEWEQACDGEMVLPILRTLPGLVVGPGHNSVVRGPDNRQLYCIYHRWRADGGARVLCIDQLDWVGDRMLVLGPSTTPQPAPLPPTLSGFTSGWRADGEWRVDDAGRSVEGSGRMLLTPVGFPSFLMEVSVRGESTTGSYGLSLLAGGETLLDVVIEPERGEGRVTMGERVDQFRLPEGFDPRAWHLLRCEVDGLLARLMLDGAGTSWAGLLPGDVAGLALTTGGSPAMFTAFEMTLGWEELFDDPGDGPALRWSGPVGEDVWRIEGRALAFSGLDGRLERDAPSDAYEMVVNVCLNPDAVDAGYGFLPAIYTDEEDVRVTIEHGESGWLLRCVGSGGEMAAALPAGFDPSSFQQFRMRREREQLSIALEGNHLGRVEIPAGGGRIGITASGEVWFDMVRVTAITPRSEG